METLIPDASTAEMIKGKTYIGWTAGVFDTYRDAASAMRITFDTVGGGTSRNFTGYDPKLTTAVQQMVTAKVHIDPTGKTLLLFTVGPGTAAGTAQIKSFNHGAKVWVKSLDPGRPMEGWMLQLPPKPAGV